MVRTELAIWCVDEGVVASVRLRRGVNTQGYVRRGVQGSRAHQICETLSARGLRTTYYANLGMNCKSKSNGWRSTGCQPGASEHRNAIARDAGVSVGVVSIVALGCAVGLFVLCLVCLVFREHLSSRDLARHDQVLPLCVTVL